MDYLQMFKNSELAIAIGDDAERLKAVMSSLGFKESSGRTLTDYEDIVRKTDDTYCGNCMSESKGYMCISAEDFMGAYTKSIFKKGDKVWDFVEGWGVITNIIANNSYGIHVDFGDGRWNTYNKNGERDIKCIQTLFFQEIAIPKEALIRPRWRAGGGESYYIIDVYGSVYHCGSDYRLEDDDGSFNSGNYFQTEEEAMASKFYKVFHEED